MFLHNGKRHNTHPPLSNPPNTKEHAVISNNDGASAVNKDGTLSTQMNVRPHLASAAKKVVPVSPEQMNVGQRLASAAWCTGIENENGSKANRPRPM